MDLETKINNEAFKLASNVHKKIIDIVYEKVERYTLHNLSDEELNLLIKKLQEEKDRRNRKELK